MEKSETDNQNGKQVSARKMRWPVATAITGAVAIVLAIVGLNLAGFISLPFLPKSPEIVLLRAINDIAQDGTFGVVANADTDAELNIEALEHEATSNLRLNATATGMACDFDMNDLSKLTIPDGSFEADFTLALDAGFLEGETENLHSSGAFDLALGEGVINYHLQEPVDHEGVIRFDTSALLGGEKKAMMRSIGLSDIHDMKMEGDIVTFTVSTASLDTSVASEVLKEILQRAGIEMLNAQTNLSDLDVSVDLGTVGSVRGNVIGTMDMTAQARKNVDLPAMLPNVPIDIDLKISVPIDVKLVLS
jgi:hypothetical protein